MSVDKTSFSSSISIEDKVQSAAKVAVVESMKIKKDERVLIITNPQPDVLTISQALYDAVLDVDAKPTMIVQPRKTILDFAEDAVLSAIRSNPDVLISMSDNKLGKDYICIKDPIEYEGKKIDNYFHYLIESKQTRSFWSPGVTAEFFAQTVPIDYSRLQDEAKRVKAVLDKAEKVYITTPGGTDLEMGLKDRVAFLDDGDFAAPGRGGNLPAGEAFISPELGASHGTIVFDGSMAVKGGTVLCTKPIHTRVENGFITSVEGDEEARILLETITEGEKNALEYESAGKLPKGLGEPYRSNARNLGELGIGLNPAATITGNMLVDEKAYRTCHIAIGSNYDEDARALIHLDGIMRNPTIVAVDSNGNETVILKDGDLAV